MPRVYITTNERLCEKLAEWVYGRMKVSHVTQKMLASKRGVSQQAISNKLKYRKFDFEDFVTFVELFNPDDEEIRRLVRG